METNQLLKTILYLATSLVLLKFSYANDTINSTQTLRDGNTLVSSGQTFELGFFSPGKSSHKYLGIRYKSTPNTLVWVANRNSPLAGDSHGEFGIEHGRLVVRNRTGGGVVWRSSNSSSVLLKNPIAQLLESGNLVLRENESAVGSDFYAWQSFDHPTDTMLSGMKLGWSAGVERYLTSWKSADDPSTGDFTFRMDVTGLPQLVLAEGSTRVYRSGLWNGVRFSGIIQRTDNNNFNNVLKFDDSDSYYMFTPLVKSELARATVNTSGSLQRFISQNPSAGWAIMYSIPYQLCDKYGYCGANGVCRLDADPVCECLEGFTPSSREESLELNWSKGCRRISPLDCRKGEGFRKVVGIKLPDLLNFRLNKSMSLEECREMCLKNCSCTAFANSDIRNGGSGCLMWFYDQLMDIRELRVKGSDQEMYVRLSASEMKLIHGANKKRKQMIILVVLATLGICVMGLIIWCLYIWKLRAKTKEIQGNDDNEHIELPLIDFAIVATATNNFCPSHVIGEGGFGPVYKGSLSTGQEIAVKRLSKNSGQGLKEFKTEVELIAKLQHRNLVVLLGCCIAGEERMLIYEYMPNKSLDHFIFDGKRSAILPWKKHFEIVKGIARGLLYLHQDSKLHIVHRDLKASNILLDNNLNPKISDFGLARTFRDDENEASTIRVVGTYGYMSPEYAVDGKFSIKSDVFSFGVLLLEIVSGKRNRQFSHPNHHHNLLGHAWLLWNKNEALDLMNACFEDSYVESQVLRCIHIALLCVQKFPDNRPTMSSVAFMLENEGAVLANHPKQPGFFVERASPLIDGSPARSSEEESYSENAVTITLPDGR